MKRKIKIDAEAAKAALTPDEAIALLRVHIEDKKKRVHTFEGFGFGLFGCDIDLKTIKADLKASEHICLSGKNMKAVGHGVALKTKKGGYIFLETNDKKLNALFKLKNIKD